MFSNSSNLQFHRSSFYDIQGNMISYQPTTGDVIVQHQPEFGLQMLKDVISFGAAFDSDERSPPPRCHPDTRKAVLSTIQEWVQCCSATDDGSILWLHGPAGVGKSAVAQTISESCAQHGQLAASFFFSRGNSGRDSMSRLFTTIAFQLAMSSPIWRERINKIVTDDPSVIHKAPAIQLEKLIIGLFSSEGLEDGQRSPGPPFLIVIDGLDECKGSRDQTTILNLISDLVQIHRLPLDFLIVSRPEPHITSMFNGDVMHRICTKVLLSGTTDTQWYYNAMYEMDQAMRDVYTYLRSGFNDIHNSERHAAIMSSVPKPWPDNHLVESLARRSGGYFIYASTVLKYVDEEFHSPITRLKEVTKVVHGKSSSSALHPLSELDELYRHILSSNPDTERLKQVLWYVICSKKYLKKKKLELEEEKVDLEMWKCAWWFSEQEEEMIMQDLEERKQDKVDVVIETILRLDPGQALLSLRGLHSLISIETYTEVQQGVRRVHINSFDVFHASFEDFLFDKRRAGKFFIDRGALEQTISSGYFDTFRNWKQMNIPNGVQAQICKSFDVFIENLDDETVTKFAKNASWLSLLRTEPWVYSDRRIEQIVSAIVQRHNIILRWTMPRTRSQMTDDTITLLTNYLQAESQYIQQLVVHNNPLIWSA